MVQIYLRYLSFCFTSVKFGNTEILSHILFFTQTNYIPTIVPRICTCYNVQSLVEQGLDVTPGCSIYIMQITYVLKNSDS